MKSSSDLFVAIRSNDVSRVSSIIFGSSKAKRTPPAAFKKAIDSQGNTPLLAAAAVGSRDLMETVSCLTQDINAKNKEGKTALHVACEKGHFDGVNWFLENGADIAAVSAAGLTALMIASKNGHSEIGQRLLMAKANPNSINKRDGFNSLMYAAQSGSVELVAELVTGGVDINGSFGGWNALGLAVQGGHPKVAQWLCQHGAQAEHRIQENWLPLMIALGEYDKIVKKKPSAIPVDGDKYLECALALLDGKANINTVNNLGQSALHLSCIRGSLSTVKWLLQHGAQADLVTPDGYTPAMFAVQNPNPKVRVLIEAYATTSPVRVEHKESEQKMDREDLQETKQALFASPPAPPPPSSSPSPSSVPLLSVQTEVPEEGHDVVQSISMPVTMSSPKPSNNISNSNSNSNSNSPSMRQRRASSYVPSSSVSSPSAVSPLQPSIAMRRRSVSVEDRSVKLQRLLDEKQQQLERQQEQLNEQKQIIESMQDEIHQYQQQKKEQTDITEALRQQICNLSEEVARVTKQRDECSSELETMRANASHWMYEISSANNNLSSEENANQIMIQQRREIQQLEQELANLSMKNASIADKLSSSSSSSLFMPPSLSHLRHEYTHNPTPSSSSSYLLIPQIQEELKKREEALELTKMQLVAVSRKNLELRQQMTIPCSECERLGATAAQMEQLIRTCFARMDAYEAALEAATTSAKITLSHHQGPLSPEARHFLLQSML